MAEVVHSSTAARDHPDGLIHVRDVSVHLLFFRVRHLILFPLDLLNDVIRVILIHADDCHYPSPVPCRRASAGLRRPFDLRAADDLVDRRPLEPPSVPSSIASVGKTSWESSFVSPYPIPATDSYAPFGCSSARAARRRSTRISRSRTLSRGAACIHVGSSCGTSGSIGIVPPFERPRPR